MSNEEQKGTEAETTTETQEDAPCLGTYLAGDIECDGDPEHEDSNKHNACGQQAECKQVAAVAAAKGMEAVELLSKMTKAEVLKEAKKLGKGKPKKTPKKKGNGKKAKGAKDTKTEKAKDAKTEKAAPKKDESKDEPKPETTETTETAAPEKTSDEMPQKRYSPIADPDHPTRQLMTDVYMGLAGQMGITIHDHLRRTNAKPGEMYILDKTPVGGGGSSYVSLYVKTEGKRDNGVLLAFLKPRTETIDIEFACEDKAVKKTAKEVGLNKKLEIKAIKDGVFKAKVTGITKDDVEHIIGTTAGLIKNKQINT